MRVLAELVARPPLGGVGPEEDGVGRERGEVPLLVGGGRGRVPAVEHRRDGDFGRRGGRHRQQNETETAIRATSFFPPLLRRISVAPKRLAADAAQHRAAASAPRTARSASSRSGTSAGPRRPNASTRVSVEISVCPAGDLGHQHVPGGLDRALLGEGEKLSRARRRQASVRPPEAARETEHELAPGDLGELARSRSARPSRRTSRPPGSASPARRSPRTVIRSSPEPRGRELVALERFPDARGRRRDRERVPFHDVEARKGGIERRVVYEASRARPGRRAGSTAQAPCSFR